MHMVDISAGVWSTGDLIINSTLPLTALWPSADVKLQVNYYVNSVLLGCLFFSSISNTNQHLFYKTDSKLFNTITFDHYHYIYHLPLQSRVNLVATS